MSNFFTDIKEDVDQVEVDLLGPSYKYYQKVSTPGQMGMSSEGSLDALVKDASGLINYVELLVSGTGPGSTTGKPLGNQFFLKTGAKCKDVKTGNIETRYAYINNIPTGQIPFISSGLGMDFDSFKGLIPAVLQDMEDLNPFDIFKGFLEGATPNCQELTMETTPSSINNNASRQTEFVTLSDIKSMDPCIFSLNNYVNPVTKKTCREAFSNIKTKRRDPIIQLYLFVISCLGLFILIKFLMKKN
tara:strand:- start:1644 stop:2378 length:735 start_codon:yes stop_codon:yes gene_type:complete